MHPKIKQVLQVALSLGIALWIFWFLYRDIEFDQLQAQLASSNWFWILLSLFIAWAGYWIRGWRWALLIRNEADQVPVSSNRAYHAVMVGYLVNLLIPRAGEVARCTVLTRNNGIPLGQAIGTVLVERSVDLLFMSGTIFIAFLLESQLFISLVGRSIPIDSLQQLKRPIWYRLEPCSMVLQPAVVPWQVAAGNTGERPADALLDLSAGF